MGSGAQVDSARIEDVFAPFAPCWTGGRLQRLGKLLGLTFLFSCVVRRHFSPRPRTESEMDKNRGFKRSGNLPALPEPGLKPRPTCSQNLRYESHRLSKEDESRFLSPLDPFSELPFQRQLLFVGQKEGRKARPAPHPAPALRTG